MTIFPPEMASDLRRRRHPMPYGAELLEGGGVRFRLWAPVARKVELCLDEGASERLLPMRSEGGGFFQLIEPSARAGTRYRYRINREQRVPDPASRFQPADVHGPSEVVDPLSFGWEDGDWAGRPWTEAVVYELHLGAFTPEGTFRAAIAKLDHLVSLGVTALELMPVADFPGARGWGYDGVYPFAPESSYGRPEEFKALVQAAHQRGLMVLLDVVFNHFGPEGNYLNLYAPAFFTERRHTPWGVSIDFDGPSSRPVREFFLNAALYWLEEFHLDGLRLDAVHAIFDESRPHLLEELSSRVRAGPGRHRPVHLILENERNQAQLLRRPSAFSAQWNDDLHHALHVLLTGETAGYYRDYASQPLRQLGRSLSEGFAFQGEPSLHQGGTPRGEPSADLSPASFVAFLQNHDHIGNRPLGERLTRLSPERPLKAATSLLLLCPQIPLLFMGQEWGCQKPFPYFCDFEPALAKKVVEGRRAEVARAHEGMQPGEVPDPGDPGLFQAAKLDWEPPTPSAADWLTLHRELLDLRRRAIVPLLPALEGPAHSEVLGERGLRVSWPLQRGGRLTVLANLGEAPLVLDERPPGNLLHLYPSDEGHLLEEGTLPGWSVAWLLEPRRKHAKDPLPPPIPRATYRLQLGPYLGFGQVSELVPYLDLLGISHLYFSPYLTARTGSPHGYDIVDHRGLNPELGTAEDFDRLVSSLRRRGMGQVLDVVANHMGVGGDDNAWWLDVLENGQASAYAPFFDIDWHPAKEPLRGKLLIPFLGEPYGAALEKGELELHFDPKAGTFFVRYFRHRFPLDPRSYPQVLGHGLAELASTRPDAAAQLRSLIQSLMQVPATWELLPDRKERRTRDGAECKRRLAELCRSSRALARFVEHNVRRFNGTPGEPASFDLLHALLEAQAFRLAFWKVAAYEINYRRFFDVNELAGLRMEEPQVFEHTHRLVLDLVKRGALHGLRIDHPDGLYDPLQYFQRLRQRTARRPPPYIVVEKILAAHEHLPDDWPVAGTTGYEFSAQVHGLFIRPEAQKPLERIYWRFVGEHPRFEDQVYEAKKLIAQTSLGGELLVLVNQLDRISEADRRTRDFTQVGLRDALTEIVACFPVYRSYVGKDLVSPEDRQHVTWAVAQAKRRNPARDHHLYDFIQAVLLLELPNHTDPARHLALTDFVHRFQQFTAPLMAKGVEDTTFYQYARLLSHNEVGDDPRRFSVSMAAFHHQNQERSRRWPSSMLSTSTHDSKRSEDARVRLAVLSELWSEWQVRVFRWSRFNRSRKVAGEAGLMPSRNDEYLLYQTLLCVWPTLPPGASELDSLRDRLEGYLRKAAREAKVHTSWRTPNLPYEEALLSFLRALLPPSGDRFLADFIPFAQKVARLGRLNSLSQVLLKLTCPGVPDLYQGSELWELNLVDPDNRRPVDFSARRSLLEGLIRQFDSNGGGSPEEVSALLESAEDGRIKLYLTWRILNLRRGLEALFREGSYSPLEASGVRAAHLCAFARRSRDKVAVVVAPRWFASLGAGTPVASAWADTWVQAPEVPVPLWVNALTGREVQPLTREGRPVFAASSLFADVPYALLVPKESRRRRKG